MKHAFHRTPSVNILGPHTRVVPNGADDETSVLHDRPDIADDPSALAKRWVEVRSSGIG